MSKKDDTDNEYVTIDAAFVPCRCGAIPEQHHHIDKYTVISWPLFQASLAHWLENGSSLD